jgi:V8-like Glu-specific endopeptidase
MEMIVFPILKALYYPDGTEIHRLIGTGFFLNSDGLFLTARHVLNQDRGAALDREDASGFAVYCVHTVNLQRKAVARYVDLSSIKMRNDTDIAAGRVEPRQFGEGDPSVTAEELKSTACVRLVTGDTLAVGTRIWSVAYPLTTVKQPQPGQVAIHAQSDAFEGTITKHYPERRDLGMLNWPCYETDMDIKGGASGGPVFIAGSGGVVCGINCSGFSAFSLSHITSLAPLSSKESVSRLFPA